MLALTIACGAAPAADEGGGPVFSIRLIDPDPPYLVGASRIEAAAIASDGSPYDAIAYMTLSVNGDSPRPDSKPPFRWEIDTGPRIERHRLEIVAIDRAGRKSILSLLSSTHPFVESVSVEMVIVPVVVRDAADRVVTGLSEEDFTVREEGVEQPIAWFSREAIPVSIAIALDTSSSMEPHLWSARKAVIEFIESRPRLSTLSLLTFNDQVFMDQDFTAEPAAIERAVGATRAEGTRTALFETIRIASLHLSKREGPRVIVLFTDGMDTVHEGDEGRLRTTIEAAQAADVSIFAVAYGVTKDSRGFEALTRMTGDTGGELIATSSASELRDAFVRVADSLGSRYVLGYEPPNAPAGGFRRIDVGVSLEGARVLARKGYNARGR